MSAWWLKVAHPAKPVTGSVSDLTEEHCLLLLSSNDLGRIAFSVKKQPEIFPVNYALDGKIVVFRTAPGTKLKSATPTRVAFEVDGWEPEAGTGWSVVVKGVVRDVTSDIDPFAESLRSLTVVPRAPGERPHWLAVYPGTITGRRFGPPT